MARWTLAEHGDAYERRWAAAVSAAFPNYERFWAAHVVPLTYRIVDPRDIGVRAELQPELIELASSHYAVFCNLAACHELLGPDGETFVRRDLYTFYSRLYSGRETADRFLGAVKDVLRLYGGAAISDRARRLALYDRRKPGLSARYYAAWRRAEDYRGEQVHDCGFVTSGSKIPRREHLPSWRRLDAVDRLRRAPSPVRIIAAEFVEGLDQAAEDLEFVEAVLNDLWDVNLAELGHLGKPERYRADQRASGASGVVGAPGTVWLNLSSQSASGTWVPQGQQGPQGQL